MDIRLSERAALRVGTLNVVVLWLRSFVLSFGAVSLALVLVGILGQTTVSLQGDAFYVALVVLAIVAAGLANMERDRRLVLLQALEHCCDEPAGGSAPPHRTPA